jgi:ABC-type nitrate/sulfonate/bicarbonate transport system ATPase subunit
MTPRHAKMKGEPLESTSAALQLVGVSRAFGAVEVFRGLDLEVARGEFVAIVGPSGCGKTTLLNLLSGFDQPSAGRIVREGTTRTVFQQDGLFPWLSAAQNIELALRHIPNAAERAQQIEELLALIGISGFGEHFPHQLSGGMRQRVEIARALAGQTDILLLDEPFSSLDYLTRLRLRHEFARLLSERPRTVVFVTHDIEEAAHLADRVVVLSERPAHICCELRINLPRPRDLTDSVVVDAVKRILDAMGLGQNAAY